MLDGRYFHEYPYTDFHELNTDWIINEELEIRKRIEDYLKKIDDLLRKQADLDKKVDDVTNHVNDVENEVNNKIADITKHVDDAENRINKKIDDTTRHVDDAENRINKKIDDANKHVDDVEKKVNDIQPKIDEQNQKINDIDNKNNENQTKINDSVKSVSYDNDLDISDGNVKLIGRIHVEKPNIGDVATPVYGYVGGGTLGNCVVWSKSPYVGIGEQKDYVMKNPQNYTLMEFPINGAFLAICGDKYAIVSAGSLLQPDSYEKLIENQKYLITSDSLVCQWAMTNQSVDTRILIPKSASGIKFEDATYNLKAEHGKIHFEMPFNHDHLYLVKDSYFLAYIVNDSITIVKPDENRILKIEDGRLIFENTYDSEDKVIFLDLGSMV